MSALSDNDNFIIELVDDEDEDEIMTSAAIAGDIMRALASDRGLRNYWTHGGGAAKIRWGTDGSFDRCVRHLGKHVTRPQGLCAEYHKEATGEWPAEKGVESAVEDLLVAHGDHNQDSHGNRGGHINKSVGNAAGRVGKAAKSTSSGSKASKKVVDDGDDIEYVALGKGSKHIDEMTKEEFIKAIDSITPAERARLRQGSDEEREGLRRLGKKHGNSQMVEHELGPEKQSKAERDKYKYEAELMTAATKRKQTYTDESWEGVLAVEGTESGDGRIFNLGSLDWATLPLPLMYQPANVGGHNASVVAGLITHVARQGNEIKGWGHVYGNMLAGEHGQGIQNMMEAGGVSVDVDKVKDADVEEVFADADEGGFMAKPETTIFNRGRVRGATLVAFPAFVEAKLAFTGKTMTASVHQSCGCGEATVLVASGHTITIPDLPPAEWFQKPTDVKMYGALTITDEGRVFGWVAPSDTMHRSVRKVVPMGGRVDYSRWMNKETIVAGGHRVKTGVLTMGCGHAATSNYGTLQNRKDHYDNTCSIFANAVVGEEPGKGVWFAGALRHGVTADQVTAALGSSLSGDWQPHPDRPGVQEFIAALLVPVPGFPMARSRPSVEYQDGLITASVVPVRYGPAEPRSDREMALDAIAQAKQIVVASLGLDPASEKRAVMALIEGM